MRRALLGATGDFQVQDSMPSFLFQKSGFGDSDMGDNDYVYHLCIVAPEDRMRCC